MKRKPWFGRIFPISVKSKYDSIYLGRESFLLKSIWFGQTYNLDKQVSDSSATATAFFGGVKGNYYTLGVNGKVKKKDCEKSLEEENRVTSILKWCQDAGKETGIQTKLKVRNFIFKWNLGLQVL